ncbi:hypothetical protein [Spirosoma sp.]|uniref:hypothetical protein n=1 Tax=Spirosoma sp. TaxID=1899569 RepID=UPI002633B188|nr:hypothetical protein [Spirosoma sp.]MCX6216391.1 hypothetical protein [Spirosoma sp.]
MALAEKIRPIADEIVKLLTHSYPQWSVKASFSTPDPNGVLDLLIRDIASDRKYQHRFTRFDAETMLKSPRETVAEVIVEFIASDARKAFGQTV